MHSKIIIALVLININSILYLDALTNPLLEGGLGSFYPSPPSSEFEGPKKREKDTIYNVKGASISDSFSKWLKSPKKGAKLLSWAFFISSQDSFLHLFG